MELAFDRLTKEYGAKIAVDRVSAALGPGVHGLLGANGAGKTTLMRMACGVLRPTSGEVRFDGRPIERMGGDYRAMLGYLPQDFGYYPEFTALDFMEYMAALKGIGRRAARERSVSATAKSAERATLSRRRRPRFPAGGATALWPPALPRAAAQGALDRGVVEVRGPDLNLQRRGALGVPGRDRPARDLPSAELREPDRHRDVLCAERGQPPRGVRGPHDCPLSGSPSPSAASASRSFMR